MNSFTWFLMSVIPILAINKLADLYRGSWEKSHKERISVYWHFCEFLVDLLVVITMAIAYKIPFIVCLKFAPLFAVSIWILYDLWWNIFNKQSLFYAGDGHGNILEYVLNYLSGKVRIKYYIFVLSVKILGLVLAIILAV